MRPIYRFRLPRVHLTALLVLAATLHVLCLGSSTGRADDEPKFQPDPKAGAGDVIVRGKFGGNIFGFEVDPNSNEGLLCEAVGNPDGTVLAAVETFNQSTGKIIKVLSKSVSQDDFIAWTVAGSIGLYEREHVKGIFNIQRTFHVINPLTGNKVNGRWTPPIDSKHIVNQVKAALDGSANVAVYALDVSTNATPVVFSSNVGANTFGPVIEITNPNFTTEAPPVMAFNAARNEVILGHDKPSPFILPPLLGFVNLATGTFLQRTGLGLGVINGIAVDEEDGILCTDTSFDSAVQFYTLSDSAESACFCRAPSRILQPRAAPISSLIQSTSCSWSRRSSRMESSTRAAASRSTIWLAIWWSRSTDLTSKAALTFFQFTSRSIRVAGRALSTAPT